MIASRSDAGKLLQRLGLIDSLICLAFALLTAFAADASTKRTARFLSQYTDVSVENDGPLRVRDTLRVFNTVNFGGIAYTSAIPFDVINVSRDGSPEPFLSKYQGNPLAIRIGVAPKRVKAGSHVYTIEYQTGPVLISDGENSSLNWNTGIRHKIPMENIKVRLHLPVCAEIKGIEVDNPMKNPFSGQAIVHADLANTVELRSNAPVTADHALFITIKFFNRAKCAQG